jgi:uracil-DNA glycosylase family 4
MSEALLKLQQEIVACHACPRLIKWCKKVAQEKVARFKDQTYWGRPVSGWGDPAARILLVGLAPAAHGANRTGRPFTGDRSGDFLFAALHRAKLCNQPTSVSKDDGLSLSGVYISMINHCAPPENQPTTEERDRCLPFLERELPLLSSLQVIIAFGSYAWDGTLRALATNGYSVKPAPKFGHAAETKIGPYKMIGCYHPSQQNTFTGRLTPAMLDAIFASAQQ